MAAHLSTNSTPDTSATAFMPLAVRLFVISVAFNYPWEMGQAFLYVGMGCSDLVTRPGLKPYAIMVTTGLLIGVLVEWVAVHVLARWTYTAAMPLIPLLEIGWVPVLQMLILPPLIFSVLARSARIRAE